VAVELIASISMLQRSRASSSSCERGAPAVRSTPEEFNRMPIEFLQAQPKAVAV
jgi:hypothetical protein